MLNTEFLHSDLFKYVILPLLVFVARITDVSIGTIRIIVVSRGNRMLAPVLGFFEVLIWIFVISNIVQHLNNIYTYLAYAGGFATGNYIGLKIEERLAMGINLVRIFTKEMSDELMHELHEKGYGATAIKAKGKFDDVDIIYSIVRRKEIKNVVEIIEHFNPNAFYTIEDVKYISHEDFSASGRNHHERHNIFRRWRLGK